MRLKYGLYNTFFGVLSQVIIMIFGLITPKLFLTSLGSEVNGLLQSISYIFTYIALLEAGVGTATIQALYGPIAKNKEQEINKILSATNIYYKKTGIIYLIIVILFAFIYPFVVDTNIKPVIIIFVILLNGLGGVINFLFQGKYRLLLQAEGKTYILTNLSTIISILTNIAKIILLLLGFNVVVIQASYLFFNIVQMIYITYYIQKNYKWINVKEKPNYDAISQKNSVLIHQISNLICNNTDVIVLTLFCNLKIVSVYTLYVMIFDMVKTLIINILGGFYFVMGQEYNSNRERYLKLHDIYEVISLSLSFSLYTIAYIFVLPFFKLYTSGITDISYIDQYLPILFVITRILMCGRDSSAQVINYAGHFKNTQWRSVLEASINLVVSIIMVNKLGIYGVLIGTIVALLYRANDMIIYANKYLLKRNPLITYKRWLINILVFCLVVIIFKNKVINNDSIINYYSFFEYVTIIGIIIICIYIFIAFIFEKIVFKEISMYLFNKIKMLKDNSRWNKYIFKTKL